MSHGNARHLFYKYGGENEVDRLVHKGSDGGRYPDF